MNPNIMPPISIGTPQNREHKRSTEGIDCPWKTSLATFSPWQLPTVININFPVGGIPFCTPLWRRPFSPLTTGVTTQSLNTLALALICLPFGWCDLFTTVTITIQVLVSYSAHPSYISSHLSLRLVDTKWCGIDGGLLMIRKFPLAQLADEK